MEYKSEDELFNSPFREPIYYIFSNSSNFVLVLLESLQPRTIKTIYSSPNLKEIIEYGKQKSKINHFHFINNTIYSSSIP